MVSFRAPARPGIQGWEGKPGFPLSREGRPSTDTSRVQLSIELGLSLEMEERWPWEAEESLETSDPLAHQRHEESVKEQLPRVVKLLPVQGTVMGSSSPHQTGDIVCYDILKRAPVYDLTSHFSDIQPHAPARGAHRHISAPTLFCLSGRGWEINDGKTYSFGTYDMLVVPPFTIHQHGGDEDAGCQIFVPQSRLFSLMGLTKREQIKFGDNPTFPTGTEPLQDEQGKLIGYRIKKGVLGIKEDIDVMLGADQKTEGVFRTQGSGCLGWDGREYLRSLPEAVSRRERFLQYRDPCDCLRRAAVGVVPAGAAEMVHPSRDQQRGATSLALYAGDPTGKPFR